MAGDWIKLQKDTPDKPEVLAVAARLNLDPDAVVGKMVRIWSWFDTHTLNGDASCVTFAFLDRLTGITGFAEQMALVGWLEQSGHNLRLPNFDFHNGETAKKRALGKNRMIRLRSDANCDASSVTNASPEKRREEKIDLEANASLSAGKLPDCPHKQIVELYGKHLPQLPQPRTWDGTRQQNLRARWAQCAKPSAFNDEGYSTIDAGIRFWDSFFAYIAKDTKLARGFESNGRTWQPDLPWIVKADNFAKIIDGKYDV